MPPSSSSTTRKISATVASRLSCSVRSPFTVRTRTPCATSSSDRALAAASSLLPYASTQSKPWAARRRAVARPIPPEPPVMIATLAASAQQRSVCARPKRGGWCETIVARLHGKKQASESMRAKGRVRGDDIENSRGPERGSDTDA